LKLKRLLIALVLVGALTLSACHRGLNTSNPQVVLVNSLAAGAQSCDLVATLLLAADGTLDSLQATEPDYYAKVKPLLQKTAKLNDAAIAGIKAAKAGDTSANWQAELVAVGGALGSEDLTVFGFKNPTSQKEVQGSIAALQMFLTAITASYGGK
jgi:hypothetical protein